MRPSGDHPPTPNFDGRLDDDVVVADARRALTSAALVAAGGSPVIWLGTGTPKEAGLDVAALLAAATAAFACHRAARHAEQTRPTWLLLATGCLLWFFGAVFDEVGTGSSMSSRDIGSLLFAIIGIVGLALLVQRCRRHRYEREEIIDGLLASVATIAVGSQFLIRPIAVETVLTAERQAQRIDPGLQAAAIGMVIPIAIALAVGVLGSRLRVLLLLLTVCLAPAAATALAGGRTAAAERGLADPSAPGWLVGFLLLAAAAWLARREPERPASADQPAVGSYLRRVGGVTCVCALAVTAAGLDASLRPGTEWVVIIAAGGCGVLIAARLTTAAAIADRLVQRTRERDRLASVLDVSSVIAGTLEVDRLLPALAAAAAQAVDRTRAEVSLIAADGTIEQRAYHGVSSEEQFILAGEPAGLSPALPDWPAVPTQRTVDDLALTASTMSAYRTIGKLQVLVTPLRADGRVIGTVELWTPHDDRPFAAEDLVAANAIGREGGLAIQNARLLAETRARGEERAMLLRVTRAATSSLELRTVLTEVAQASLGVAGAECCTILLWHPESAELEIGAEQTIPDWPGVEEPGNRFPLAELGSDSLVIAARTPRCFRPDTPDLAEHERQSMSRHGIQSTLVVPLLAGASCFGTLTLFSRREGAFDDRAVRLGQEIAAQTGLAIQNARLLEEARLRAAEPAILLQVSRAATSSLDLGSVLDEIAHAVLDIPGVECCAVLLWDGETSELVMGAEVTVPDWPGVDPPGTRYPLNPGDSYYQLLQRRNPMLFEADDPDLAAEEREQMAEWGAQSVFVFPLWVGDDRLGVLQVYSRHPRAFGPTVFRLGRDVSAQTALAIHNAQLLEETRRHAEEQAALLRVSRAVSSSLRLGEVLDEAARASLGVAGAEACEIELWHPEQEETELVAHHHVADWVDSKCSLGARLPLADWPVTRRILTSRAPLIYDRDDPALTEREREILFSDNTKSGFAVPIVLDDRCLGLFSLYSRQPGAVSARAVALGQDLAGQAAL
ncbi:MAG: hypothetical protein QOJ59_2649, partial [Thermomicrobiales bacterium]|nr:hypothetical protein [Thermomicrobiales bacterium]